MDQIGVVGLSYRHAGADDIAGFTLPKDELAARLVSLRATIGTSEVVYLATCNRVEVLFAMQEGEDARDIRAEIFQALSGRPPRPGEARLALRARTGEAAVEHLFMIACGLDSAQAGEREIAAQLRGAWESAREAGVSGPVLDRILREALSLSGRLQRMAAEARPPSLADLAADRIQHHLGVPSVATHGTGNGAARPTELATTTSGGSHLTAVSAADGASGGAAHSKSPMPVALVGVSPMTRRCGERLHRAGIPIIVVNRTAETGEEFARTIGATAVPLTDFRARPRDVAAIVVATGGTEPVLDAEALGKLAATATSNVLIIDFGLPPNVDPTAAKSAGFARIGMGEMIQAAQDRRIAQLLRLAPMRAAIDDRLSRLRSQLATRAIGPQLAGLRNEFERIAAAETERALNEELQQLNIEQQEQVRRVANVIAHRLAHLPLAGIRAAAAYAPAEAVETFFREARLQRALPNALTSASTGPLPDPLRGPLASTQHGPFHGLSSGPLQGAAAHNSLQTETEKTA